MKNDTQELHTLRWLVSTELDSTCEERDGQKIKCCRYKEGRCPKCPEMLLLQEKNNMFL